MDKSELLRQSLARIQALKARVAKLESAANEPIAIVGMGLRFPGGLDSPDAFWDGLRAGADVVGEIPSTRWPEGAAQTRHAGMLEDIYAFEPSFFGLSEREARTMDPQQRLVLEVAYDTLTDAGLSIASLRASSTGVYVGSSSFDWSLLAFTEDHIDAYAATGSSHSILANRLSYLWDLRGPSMAVDAACASSLVTVHLAMAALRRGECERALAGGVQVHLVPEMSLSLARFGLLAEDGRCKAFDSRANGFVRAEGCAMLMLARLSDVDLERDRVYALIHGSAINQDGRSNGLTAPSSRAQAEVLRAALANARLDPDQVGYIEAHGTGTSLGDPIEFQGLMEVYGGAKSPCMLGSVKTNLGHTEATAGVAGLIKAALTVYHREVPPHLHFRQLNPHIELEGTRFEIPTEPRAWTPTYAAVSSFGFGGTNSHALIGPAPKTETPHDTRERPLLAALSAASPQSLRARAQQLLELSQGEEFNPRELAYTLGARSTHHAWRVPLRFENRTQLRAALELVHPVQAPQSSPRVVFLCSGQGGHWLSMGRALAEWSPVFRATFERCERAIETQAGWSLSEAIGSKIELARIDRVQPALVAVQLSLAALWRSLGIEPDLVLGASLGELSAAAIAGLLSPEDALRVVLARSRLIANHSGPRGAMASIGLSEQDMRARLASMNLELEIAVINSPTNVVVAGEPSAVEALVAQLDAEGLFARRVRIDYASHSRFVEQPAQALEGELRREPLRPSSEPSEVEMISTVRPGLLEHADDPAYWRDNLRQPVQLWRALSEQLRPHGDLIIELSPHPVLSVALEDGLGALEPPSHIVCAMTRESGPSEFLDALGRAWTRGLEFDWSALWSGIPARVSSLPSYPWTRKHFAPQRAPATTARPSTLSTPAPELAPAPAPDPVVPTPELHPSAAGSVRPFVVSLLMRELYASEALPEDIPLRELGLDSLVASHLRARLVERGYQVSLLEVMQAASIQALVAKLDGDPSKSRGEAPSPPVPTPTLRTASASPHASPHVTRPPVVAAPRRNTTRSRWFLRPRPRPDAEQLLYCFPYGGGSASNFRAWLEPMPAWLELRTVELPGRGTRLGEPAPTEVDQLVASIGEAMLVDLDDRPFSLYGHCAGSMLAYEVAHYIRVAGRTPRHLFAAAANIPRRNRLDRAMENYEDTGQSVEQMDDAFLLGFLRRFEFQGLEEFERDPELRAIAFATLRADSQLLSDYELRERSPLPVPITVMGGGRDPWNNAYELWLWSKLTSQRFDWRWFPDGNHYFHIPRAPELAELFEQLRVEKLPPGRPLSSKELAPIAVLQAFYSTASEDPDAAAMFAAPDASWTVRDASGRELKPESPWLADTRVAPHAVVYSRLKLTEGADANEVLVQGPVELNEAGESVQHEARYRVREGLIVDARVELGAPPS